VVSAGSGSGARPWSRWQDWAAVVLGAYLVLSTLWTETTGGALAALLVLGFLMLVSGLWSLATPASMTSEYVHIALGVLLFVSPWALGFADLGGASWTAWILGVLAVLVGAAALPEANAAHRAGG
jgi:uncharacterized membrane protein HdeD (DUF308 family)